MKKGHGLTRNELFEMITLTNRKIDTKTNLLKSENHTEMLLHHQPEKPLVVIPKNKETHRDTKESLLYGSKKTKNNLKSQ